MAWSEMDKPCPNCGECPDDDLPQHPEPGICLAPLGSGYDEDFSGLGEYRKKTTIRAVRIPAPFFVKTLEGDALRGEPGHWLAEGIKGERYPIAPDVFEKTYELVGNEPTHPEIERLSQYLLKHHSHELGRGNPREGESAVEVAIRMLDERAEKHDLDADIDALRVAGVEVATVRDGYGEHVVVVADGSLRLRLSPELAHTLKRVLGTMPPTKTALGDKYRQLIAGGE